MDAETDTLPHVYDVQNLFRDLGRGHRPYLFRACLPAPGTDKFTLRRGAELLSCPFGERYAGGFRSGIECRFFISVYPKL
jgi:hypothetical protein